MKSRILFLFLAVVLIVSLVAFSACKAEEEKEAPPPAPEAWQWPSMLTIATGAAGTTGHAELSSIAPLIEKDTGMSVRIVPEDSHPLKNQWLKAGMIDMFFDSVTGHASNSQEAKGDDASRLGGPHRVRIPWMTFASPWGMMVKGDSPMETIYDIGPGTKIALYPVPGIWAVWDGLLEWVGVDKNDVEFIECGSYGAMPRAVVEGRADVTYITPTFGYVVEAAASPKGIKYLKGLDPKENPEGATKLAKYRPTLLYAECTEGVKEAYGITMFASPQGLMSSANVDPELIYQFVKWLNENYDVYVDKHATNKYFHIDGVRNLFDTMYLPIHEGTIKYLKEVGKWSDADDRRQVYNIDLNERYIIAYQQAIDAADTQELKIDPKNEEWINFWENYKNQLGIPRYQLILEH